MVDLTQWVGSGRAGHRYPRYVDNDGLRPFTLYRWTRDPDTGTNSLVQIATGELRIYPAPVTGITAKYHERLAFAGRVVSDPLFVATLPYDVKATEGDVVDVELNPGGVQRYEVVMILVQDFETVARWLLREWGEET